MYLSIRVGIGIGPATRAPVRLAVSTISIADSRSGSCLILGGEISLSEPAGSCFKEKRW